MYFNKSSDRFLFTLLFIILFSSFASAEICEAAGFMGNFQQNSNITLTQTCPTCTFLNITVTDPTSLVLFNNTPMTFSDNLFSFGPNSSITQVIGTYFVQGTSNLDNPFKACYTVTNISTQITTPESIIYIILTIGVFMLFIFTFWAGIGLPARNRRNELNRVIGVEFMKYPKLGCLFLSYAFFTWLINILFTISSNFVTLTQFQGFFEMIFNFLLAGLYAFFVATIVIFFILAAKDLRLVNLLTRGIQGR